MSTRAYGALAIGSAVVGILAAIGSLGLGSAVSRFGVAATEADTRKTSRVAAADAFAVARPAAVGLVLLSLLIAAGMQVGSRLGAAGLVVLALAPMSLVTPYQSVVSGYMVAAFRPRLASGMQAVVTLCQLGLIALAVAVGLVGAYQVALIRMAVGVGGFIVLLRQLNLTPLLRSRLSQSSPASRQMLRFGWAMTLTTMAGIVISQLDVLVLGIARGPAAAGLYAPVSRLADTALLLPNALGAYLLPAVASSAARGDEQAAGVHYHWASRWALVIAAPAVAALLLTPGALIHALFGVGTHGLIAPARVLALGVLVHLLFGFNGMTLDALGDARLVAVRSGYGVLLSAAACAVLVPAFGALGAAIATTTAILGLNATCSVMLIRRHRIAMWDRRILAVVGALGLGLLGGWALLPALNQGQYPAVLAVGALAVTPGLAVAVILDWPGIRGRLRRPSPSPVGSS
jgi:O-antigen/teichoic acid export membrane protein